MKLRLKTENCKKRRILKSQLEAAEMKSIITQIKCRGLKADETGNRATVSGVVICIQDGAGS